MNRILFRRVLICLARAIFPLALLSQAGAVTRLPTEAFARLPMIEQATISPDGLWYAGLMNRGSENFVVSRSVDGDDATKVLFRNDSPEYRILWLHWVSNERLVFSIRFPSLRGKTKAYETRLVALNRDGSKILTLVEPSKFKAYQANSQFQDRVVDWLPEDGHHILLQASTESYNVYPDVIRVDVDTGKREVVQRNRNGVIAWLTDRTHRVRVSMQQSGAAVEIAFCDPDGEHWRKAWSYEVFERATVHPIGFAADPNLLYVIADHEGKYAVYEVDLRDPALPRRLMLSDPKSDLGGALLLDPISGKAVGIGDPNIGDSAAGIWDADMKAFMRDIDIALPRQANRLVQFSADGSRYLVFGSGNGIPGQFFVGDKKRREVSPLASQYPQLPEDALAKKVPFVITARDGTRLPSLLTLPGDAAQKNLPAVVLPHGGPISMDSSDFDPLVAFLANRGYAVLQVNFRGSAGFGFDHMKAGLKRWGLEMQDDVTDAVKWLVQRGTADANRVCIVGGSYGGYAALMGGATTPQLYRCVVSFAGVSDLVDLDVHERKFLNGEEIFTRQVGSSRDERQRMRNTSPRTLAAQFRAPVLLIHGTADRIVPIAQSQNMAEALTDAGKNVRWIKLEDGDHNMSYQSHRLQIYQELEKFLGEHLAPTEPSTATVAR